MAPRKTLIELILNIQRAKGYIEMDRKNANHIFQIHEC